MKERKRMQVYRKVYIKTLEELEKRRFHLFGCEIHIPREVDDEIPDNLAMSLKLQNNYIVIDDKEVTNAKN